MSQFVATDDDLPDNIGSLNIRPGESFASWVMRWLERWQYAR